MGVAAPWGTARLSLGGRPARRRCLTLRVLTVSSSAAINLQMMGGALTHLRVCSDREHGVARAACREGWKRMARGRSVRGNDARLCGRDVMVCGSDSGCARAPFGEHGDVADGAYEMGEKK